MNRQLNEVGAIKQSKDLDKERVKGQQDQRGRKCLNSTHWEEIGQRKESRERRGPVATGDQAHFQKHEEDEIDGDLKIMMEKLGGDLFTHSHLPNPFTLSF